MEFTRAFSVGVRMSTMWEEYATQVPLAADQDCPPDTSTKHLPVWARYVQERPSPNTHWSATMVAATPTPSLPWIKNAPPAHVNKPNTASHTAGDKSASMGCLSRFALVLEAAARSTCAPFAGLQGQ